MPGLAISVGLDSVLINALVSSGGSANDMSSVVLVLTPEEIEAAYTTPLVVAAGAVGSFLLPVSMVISHDNTGGEVSPVSGSGVVLDVRYGTDVLLMLQGSIDITQEAYSVSNGLLADSNVSAVTLTGGNLTLAASGPSTTGVLTWTVTDAGAGYIPTATPGEEPAWTDVNFTGGAGSGASGRALIENWYAMVGGNANNPNINLLGDHTAVFTPASTFEIVGSELNDGTYTVVSSAYSDPYTIVDIVETPPSGNPVGGGWVGITGVSHGITAVNIFDTGTGYEANDVISVDGVFAGTGGEITVGSIGMGMGNATVLIVYQAVPVA